MCSPAGTIGPRVLIFTREVDLDLKFVGQGHRSRFKVKLNVFTNIWLACDLLLKQLNPGSFFSRGVDLDLSFVGQGHRSSFKVKLTVLTNI